MRWPSFDPQRPKAEGRTTPIPTIHLLVYQGSSGITSTRRKFFADFFPPATPNTCRSPPIGGCKNFNSPKRIPESTTVPQQEAENIRRDVEDGIWPLLAPRDTCRGAVYRLFPVFPGINVKTRTFRLQSLMVFPTSGIPYSFVPRI